jgi:ADP-ribosylglycohydrolase
MSLPSDYVERVYAGVLGKIIGVYLGRPFEGWNYDAIMEHLGEINYYVHEKLNVPLIVTDDDISGTFTFLRALPDYGNSGDLTPAQIGQSWLNYIIEDQTILWWGGMGNSTEHTAYLRLKSGIKAPHSGSMELNGKVVSEQIGSQIFIDGWAMVAPGNPEFATDLARRAASVSHDGEAIYGAQIIAAMEAQAFVEADINKLIDTAVSFIPKDSIIACMINDIRGWHAKEPDWRKGREKLAQNYGYHIYGGNCHMVPNHGLIILSLLYGDDDFQKTQMIVNTSGWDTDCNAGNVGCLMGIKNGLAGIDCGPDWRGPVADQLYLPTADSGRSITDAVTETFHVANIGRGLAGLEPLSPKNGARFHFNLPGSVQGFTSEDTIESRDVATLENVIGHSQDGNHSLAVHYKGLAEGRFARISTPTFIPSKEVATYFDKRGYSLLASPTLYTGQTVQARLEADTNNTAPVTCRLYARAYNESDNLVLIGNAAVEIAPGEEQNVIWTVEDTNGLPISSVGIEICGENGTSGTVYVDYLTWDGTPNVVLNRPFEHDPSRKNRGQTGIMWKKAWTDSFDSRERLTMSDSWPEPYRLIQNRGRGLLMQGTRDWVDYQVTARLTPHMCEAGGVAVRVQGTERYYALILDGKKARIIRALDGDTVLAETDFSWKFGVSYELNLQVEGNRLTGLIDGKAIITVDDPDNALTSGGIALLCEVGRIGCDHVAVQPLDSKSTGIL